MNKQLTRGQMWYRKIAKHGNKQRLMHEMCWLLSIDAKDSVLYKTLRIRFVSARGRR